MTYEIAWTGRARKDILRLQPKDQRRVADAVSSLSVNPRPMGSKKLEPVSEGRYTLRVTYHLRVLYMISDDARKVLVLEVGQREGRY